MRQTWLPIFVCVVAAVSTSALADAPANGRCWTNSELDNDLYGTLGTLMVTKGPDGRSYCGVIDLDTGFPACSGPKYAKEFREKYRKFNECVFRKDVQNQAQLQAAAPQSSNKKSGKEAYDVGERYFNAKNYAEAIRSYEQAGDYGPALDSIGWLYDHGLGVSEDNQEALRWYQRAANLGNVDAMRHIGVNFSTGIGNTRIGAGGNGVQEDADKAIYWLTKAAMLGDENSMIHLAHIYGENEILPTDFDKALYWTRKALARARATRNSEAISQATADLDALNSHSDNGRSTSSRGFAPPPKTQGDESINREIYNNNNGLTPGK